jgi:hypothetical protein
MPHTLGCTTKRTRNTCLSDVPLTLIATEVKKDESRGGKNCHDETMMNTKS